MKIFPKSTKPGILIFAIIIVGHIIVFPVTFMIYYVLWLYTQPIVYKLHTIGLNLLTTGVSESGFSTKTTLGYIVGDGITILMALFYLYILYVFAHSLASLFSSIKTFFTKHFNRG